MDALVNIFVNGFFFANVVFGLHVEPDFGAVAEEFAESDCHIHRNSSLASDDLPDVSRSCFGCFGQTII